MELQTGSELHLRHGRLPARHSERSSPIFSHPSLLRRVGRRREESLFSLVQQIKLCTVAIALDLGPQLHPKILGTGFTISEKGHILTNAHVATALLTPLEYRHTLQLSPRACIITYQLILEKGMAEIRGRINGIMNVTGKNVAPGGLRMEGRRIFQSSRQVSRRRRASDLRIRICPRKEQKSTLWVSLGGTNVLLGVRARTSNF